MNFPIFFLTFGILFLGELGDKTQLIVFNLSLKYQKSYKIGIGATFGFALIVTIGLILGSLITTFLPIPLITLISGLIFIIIGIIEVINLRKILIAKKKGGSDKSNFVEKDEFEEGKRSKLHNNPYLAGFGFIFLMELGDKTQILTITLASVYQYPFEVWLGSFLALSTLAWMGVFIGALIVKKVPKVYLKLTSIIIFLLVGILTLITSI